MNPEVIFQNNRLIAVKKRLDCNKQNKLFKEKWAMTTMMLHAYYIRLKHPLTNETIEIVSRPSGEFLRTIDFLGIKPTTSWQSQRVVKAWYY